MANGSLLQELRIERAEIEHGHAPRNDRGRAVWVGLAMGALLLSFAGAYLWTAAHDEIATAIATPVGDVAGGPLASALDASGYVVARNQATVSSKITGRLAQVLIEEGQSVRHGQVLARLDPVASEAMLREASAQAETEAAALQQARVHMQDAQARYARSAALSAKGFLSNQDLDTARAAAEAARYAVQGAGQAVLAAAAARDVDAQELDDTVIRAPFDGVVTVKAAQKGEVVSPVSGGGGFTRTGICTIVDMSSLEVQVDVSESYIARVHPGMPAVVLLNAYPQWRIPAQVLAVIPSADRAKATVGVRVKILQFDPRIIPEMGARVTLMEQGAGSAQSGAPTAPRVVVPSKAVLTSAGRGPSVFVVVGDRLEQRPVSLGPQTANGVVINGGLRPGERVAASNVGALHDGQRAHVKSPPTSHS